MFEDAVTHEPREVDVVVESSVAGHVLRLAIECRDHDRPADTTWVESMAKKHEHLPTDKLVLWSAKGFYKPALAKANFLKIETVSQRDAAETDWKNIARKLIGGSIKLVTPAYDSVVDIRRADGACERLPARGDYALRPIGGEASAGLASLLNKIKAHPDVGTVLLDHAPEGAGDFFLTYEPQIPTELLDDGRCLGTVLRVIMSIHTISEVGPLETRSVARDGHLLTLATSDLPNGNLEIALFEARDKPLRYTAAYRPKKR